jgi:hypothetical protein
MHAHRVRSLLMGGQACVFYGAAEFSRDTDLAILADGANLKRLRLALKELQADVIAVPPFRIKYLQNGHALHFRCQHPEAFRMRVDIMAKMRGVDSFSKLWTRRTTFHLSDATPCDLLSLPDLVQAKKTQRDKDWPMIRRLLEAHYFQNNLKTNIFKIRFWLSELRTAQLLVEVAQRYTSASLRLEPKRPLLMLARKGQMKELEKALSLEEALVREQDRQYWKPLRAELEKLRHPKK